MEAKNLQRMLQPKKGCTIHLETTNIVNSLWCKKSKPYGLSFINIIQCIGKLGKQRCTILPLT